MNQPSSADVNRVFYNNLWSKVRWPPPEQFNTWPFVQALLHHAPRRLEVGPGMRPRLPINGTDFVDLSSACVERLCAKGGRAQCASATSLPFSADTFDVVCAFDIVEHVDEDEKVLQELVRVLRPGGTLVLSVPLYAKRWTPFDAMCGHVRRYEPEILRQRLNNLGLTITHSGGFGMQPRQWLVDLGMFFFRVMPRRAMFFYNYLFLPIGMRMQNKLSLTPADSALIDGVFDDVIIRCQK
jgi:SAM-dependent methyltransferase